MNLEEMKKLSPEQQAKLFKRIDEIRAVGKSTNYACQYGAGVATIARTAKVSTAVAKKLHAAYHQMNWSIAKIAKMMVVKKTDFGDWQINPINKMWYSLRSDKDRFSTLIQGTGAYILDLWLYHCEKIAKKRGMHWVLVGQFHDELIIELDDDKEQEYYSVVEDGLKAVNDQLKLNRELACDIKFGDRYSDIH
jgi:DNA polymerase I-like protein with 3'-5' exonuclease and polymerase domains